jgi:hypothetical protein
MPVLDAIMRAVKLDAIPYYCRRLIIAASFSNTTLWAL